MFFPCGALLSRANKIDSFASFYGGVELSSYSEIDPIIVTLNVVIRKEGESDPAKYILAIQIRARASRVALIGMNTGDRRNE